MISSQHADDLDFLFIRKSVRKFSVDISNQKSSYGSFTSGEVGLFILGQRNR